MFKKTPAIQVFVKPFCISLNLFLVKLNFVFSFDDCRVHRKENYWEDLFKIHNIFPESSIISLDL